jgi:multicomponent Na+:H+ antiporter subunit D
MRSHLPLLILLAPWLGAPLALLAGFFSTRLARLTALAALALSLFRALHCFPRLLQEGSWRYQLGGWAPPWGIELSLTPLSCSFLCLILLVSLLALFYSGGFSAYGHVGKWNIRFFPPFQLILTSSLLTLILVRDTFSLYLFWEIALVAAAGLLVLSHEKGRLDALNLLLWGSVGASLFLFGCLCLYAVTGTAHLGDLLAQLFIFKNYPMALIAGLFLSVAWAYAFLFPAPFFFTRLLNQTPPFILGLLSSVLVRVAAYLLFILLFFVLGVPGLSQPTFLVIAEYGVALLFLSAFVAASRQKDFQHMVAYLGVGQLGFLFLGFLLGNKSALTGTLMELLSQLPVVAGLFFIAGTLRVNAGTHPFSRMAGLVRHRPLTGLSIVFFASSIVGVPPTGGFFGKFFLVLGALEKRDWVALAAIAGAVLFNFIYFTKLTIFLCEHRAPSLSQAPDSLASKIPIVLLVVVVFLLGGFHDTIIHNLIEPALPKAFLDLPVPNVPFLGRQVE